VRRRPALATVGAGLASLAGCGALAGETATPPAEERPTVTAGIPWYGGLSRIEQRSRSVEGGQLNHGFECRLTDAGDTTERDSLSESAWIDLQRLVLSSEPAPGTPSTPAIGGVAPIRGRSNSRPPSTAIGTGH